MELALSRLSELIDAAMREQQLTSVREAARRCNMTHQALRKILIGETKSPSDETLEELSRGLRIRLGELRSARLEDTGRLVVEDVTGDEALMVLRRAAAKPMSPAEREAMTREVQRIMREMREEGQ